jgi:AraC-like DNA-binding protein
MDPRIAHVISSMERDLDGSLTIGALADAVNLSPSRLTVLFKRETGVSPVRYLRALRMERARLLLERTFLSVKEVMAFVGVNDPSHFTRDFSRHYGIAPSRLRQDSWAPEAWRSRAIGQRTRPLANDRRSTAAAAIVERTVGDAPNPDGQPISRRRDGGGENDQ